MAYRRTGCTDAMQDETDLDPLGVAPVTMGGVGGRAFETAAANRQRSSFEKGRHRLASIQPSSNPFTVERASYVLHIQDIESHLEAQEKTIQLLQRQVREAQRDYRALGQENRTHLRKIAQLESQVSHLSSILAPIPENQVDDSDVKSKFASLRSSINTLVHATWTTALKDGIDLERLTQGQEVFFKITPISYERLRSAVFYHIHEIILAPPNYFLDDRIKKHECHLGQFEIALKKNSSAADRREAAEWRRACFKATDKYRGDGDRLSDTAQRRIWQFLNPLRVKDTPAAQSAGKRLKDICDNAVKLSLTMRQSTDEFRFDYLSRALNKPISAWDQWAEEWADIPAPADTQPGTIAYVMTSALVKSPQEDMERDIVLEKAQVAVYKDFTSQCR